MEVNLLISQPEFQQILMDWNNTTVDFPRDKCIHHLFEEQARKSPNSLAVVFENEQLTYQELNNQANQLAHYLQKFDVGPEILVGICIERSLEMVISLLGILKAGGAYVPIDPNYPQERIKHMLEDSQVKVLLSQSSLVPSLPSLDVICIDSDWIAITQEPKFNLDFAINSDNLAYVMYTSGSTGKPKGVPICHFSVVNLLSYMHQALGLTNHDISLSVTTISFDMFVLELYLPLVVGAQVVLCSREVSLDSKKLLQKLCCSKCTLIQATPATWQILLSTGFEHALKLKILTGGEALSLSLRNQLLGKCDSLWNLYGPTEATVWSTIYRVRVDETRNGSGNSFELIGRPIANTQIYILDEHLEPVSIGILGELYIGGIGLARGYLNRPELTDEKFISSPFKKGERLYKTGDLARYLPDGDIEYLGRIDNQVKIRGFRIELGEIEAVLESHPLIQQAIVMAREDDLEDKKLVAYLVTQNKSINNSHVRFFLKEKLPEFMIPAFFVALEKFPLTPNGKVDRKILLSLDNELNRKHGYIEPRTENEKLLASLWSQILKVKKVGIHDNFFELGGHSLLATKLLNKIEENFHLELPLSFIFQAPTIQELTLALESKIKLPVWYSLIPIQSVGFKPPLFEVFYLSSKELSLQLGKNQPVYGLRYGIGERAKDIHLSLPTIENLASHFIQEMCSLQAEGPYFLMGHSFGGLVAYEMAQQLVLKGEKIGLLALFDTYAGLSINKVPLSPIQKINKLIKKGPEEFFKKIQRKIEGSKVQNDFYFPHLHSSNSLSSIHRDYEVKPYSGRVILFQSMNRLLNFKYQLELPEIAWKKLVCQKNLIICEVPGSHDDMLMEPNVKFLAKKLKEYI